MVSIERAPIDGENPISWLRRKLRNSGPAWLSAGLNIGGGSVTTAVILTAATGFRLSWVYFFAIMAVWVCIHICTKISIVSGKYPIQIMREDAHPVIAWINSIALLVTNTIFFGTQIALGSDALTVIFPGLRYRPAGVIFVLLVGAVTLLPRKSNALQSIMKYLLLILVISYVLALFAVDIDWQSSRQIFHFSMPEGRGEILQFAAVMGMCLAFNIPVSQAWGSVSNKWREDRLSDFYFETTLTNLLWIFVMFIIIAVVASTLFVKGMPATSVISAAESLFPIAGRFSGILFAVGLLGAVLTTAVVIAAISGYVLTDVLQSEVKMTNPRFRFAQIVTVLFGFTIPVFGWNAFSIVVWGAAFNVTFMVLGIGTWWYLINKKEVMGIYRAGVRLNILIAIASVIAIVTVFRFWYVTLS